MLEANTYESRLNQSLFHYRNFAQAIAPNEAINVLHHCIQKQVFRITSSK